MCMHQDHCLQHGSSTAMRQQFCTPPHGQFAADINHLSIMFTLVPEGFIRTCHEQSLEIVSIRGKSRIHPSCMEVASEVAIIMNS